MPAINPREQKRAAIRVTLIGAVLDLVLGILKIMVGTLSGSFALVSDGIHSLSDLLTDIFVLLIARVSREAPDAEHPYGHGRFETLGTIIIGISLFIVAGVICYDSLRRVSSEGIQFAPGFLALFMVLLSIASKEWIYRYTKRVADQINSSMLLANAWHSRTDALSSIVVLIGIVGAEAGYLWMDLVAAVIVGLLIARMAWRLMKNSLKELVDTALPEEDLETIRTHILGLTGIDGVHGLRSRQHAGQSFLDIHVQVDNKISVSEGHYLGDRIVASLKHKFPTIADVIIHIDPELDKDDEEALEPLPLRKEVLVMLFSRWQGQLEQDQVEKVVLHYLDNKVLAEIYIKNNIINKELLETLNKMVEGFWWLEKVSYYETF